MLADCSIPIIIILWALFVKWQFARGSVLQGRCLPGREAAEAELADKIAGNLHHRLGKAENGFAVAESSGPFLPGGHSCLGAVNSGSSRITSQLRIALRAPKTGMAMPWRW